MRLFTKQAGKRLVILGAILLVVVILTNSFCTIIEIPPYLVKRPARLAFVPAQHGQGELFFHPDHKKIPILILRGSPEELGAQQGHLLQPQLEAVMNSYLERFLSWGNNKKIAEDARDSMKPFVPPRYRRELEAMSQASGVSFERLLLLQTIIDEPRLPFCSVVIASGPATREGELLFGRNLDFPSLGIAEYYSLITVFHPERKKSFAAITWPGFIGVISGINEDGLALAMLVSFDGGTNIKGIPSIMLFRRILEEASDMDGAMKIIKQARRTAPTNIAMADASGQSAIIEFTADDVAVRYSKKGLLYCTNWFRTEKMSLGGGDERYGKMVKLAERYYGQIGLTETIDILREVPITRINLQSMVISPRKRIIYLSTGSIPAAKGEFLKIDLKAYLE